MSTRKLTYDAGSALLASGVLFEALSEVDSKYAKLVAKE